MEEVNALLARLNLGFLSRIRPPQKSALFPYTALFRSPYAALPQIGRDYATELKGKVVLDTCNPIENRDGAMAVEMRSKGTGVGAAELLPRARLGRAFNWLAWNAMRSAAHRPRQNLARPP